MTSRIRRAFLIVPMAALLLGSSWYKTELQEEASIRQAIDEYLFEGLRTGDTALLDQIIHPDWRLVNVRDDHLVQYDRETFYSWQSGGEDSEDGYEILSIDITGPIASVKTREDAGDHFWIDYLHLAKAEGRWWVIGKIAHPVNKGLQ